MFDLSQGRGWSLWVLCGAACITFALLGTVGLAFSSVGVAFAAFILVDVPLAFGLFGSRSGQAKFPMLSIFGSSVVLISIIWLYSQDIAKGLSSASFFYEREGWLSFGFLFGLNSVNIFLAAMKIKEQRSITGASS
jgi:hypothetical protein